MIDPDLLCPECGEVERAPFHPGDMCHCGGVFVDVGVDVLKALLPFSPAAGPCFRVWQVVDGVPVGLGHIRRGWLVTDEDIIRRFHKALGPEGDVHIRLRLVNNNGQEMGSEQRLHIPQENPVLLRARGVVT